MKNNFNQLLHETFVFRPFNSCEGKGITVTTCGYKHQEQGLLRYADGQWIPDDGQYDLAFAHGVFAYGVNLPDYCNSVWGWYDMKLTRGFLPEYLHKYAHGHHIQTIDNRPLCHWDNSQHPNEVAFKAAMKKVSSLHGCANGRGAYLTSESPDTTPWLKEKRVLIQTTMQPILIPEKPICYLCLENGKGHLIEALQSYKEHLEYNIEDAEQTINKAKSDIVDAEYTIEKANKHMPEIIEELKDLVVSL